MGVRVLPPCVNESFDRWTAQTFRDASGVEKPAIRTGLRAIFGLSGALRERIIARRGEARFTGAADFFARVRPSGGEARYLVDSGALDRLGLPENSGGKPNRNELHWLAQVFGAETDFSGGGTAPALAYAAGEAASGAELFDRAAENGFDVPRLPAPSPREMALAEWRALGFSPRAHPVEIWRREIADALSRLGCANGSPNRAGETHGAPVISETELARYAGRRVAAAGYVIEARRTVTKQDRRMRFVTLDRPGRDCFRCEQGAG